MNKGKIAFAKPVSAAKIALMIVATIALPPSHISTITKLTINILNQYIKFNVKWVIFYTLIFHEENDNVTINTISYMRKIVYNEFINFYKFLTTSAQRWQSVGCSLSWPTVSRWIQQRSHFSSSDGATTVATPVSSSFTASAGAAPFTM